MWHCALICYLACYRGRHGDLAVLILAKYQSAPRLFCILGLLLMGLILPLNITHCHDKSLLQTRLFMFHTYIKKSFVWSGRLDFSADVILHCPAWERLKPLSCLSINYEATAGFQRTCQRCRLKVREGETFQCFPEPPTTLPHCCQDPRLPV